jgi:uncharacterized protein YjbI with pentapeptide repeats
MNYEERVDRHANAEHVSVLEQGVYIWNKWRKEHPAIRPHITSLNHPFHSKFNLKDLRRIDLSNCDLAGANFDGVDFQDANFEDADLTVVSFNDCNLSNTNLSHAFMGSYFKPSSFEIYTFSTLRNVNLSGANIEWVELHQATLEDVNLKNVSLIGAKIFDFDFNNADFAQSHFGRTLISNTDLSSAINLDKINHHSPSHICIDTIYRSKGQIHPSFLRGCGIPDIFIDFVNSLTSEAIQYYTCFISYSTHDKLFANRLYNDLQKNGVRCWFAPENMRIGQRIRPTIDHSIHINDKLLLILSKNSITSQWVEKEVETAFDEERKRLKPVLFPVRIDDTVMETPEAWAADIRRTRHIGNFTDWENYDTYSKAFNILLRDLKSEKDNTV